MNVPSRQSWLKARQIELTKALYENDNVNSKEHVWLTDELSYVLNELRNAHHIDEINKIMKDL